MQMEKNEKYTILIFKPFQRRTNIFWNGSEKDRATFFGSSKHCLYIRAVDVPSPHRFHKPKGGDDERPRTSIAPHSADRRAHPGRTPTGPNGVARAAPLLLKNAPESSPERHWA